MAPWSTDHAGRNWRFIILMIYMTIVALGCAYGIKKALDASDQNALVIRKIAVLGKESDYKLCVSVKKGKEDRIREYQFTLRRTIAAYKANPDIPRNGLQIAMNFYHDLIRRTERSIVPCPPAPE